MKNNIHHEFVSISSQTAKHRIILIHGWGADADDLLPLGTDIKEKTNIDFDIISLRASNLHSNNTGRQWYGLYPPDWNEAENEVKKLFLTLKQMGLSKVPLKNTILLGFSQGAAMAIDAGSKLDIGLIVSCSGYPHPHWEPAVNCPPMIISHGLMDQIVPISASRTIYEKVRGNSLNFCELLEFNGYHQIDINLIDIINLKIKDIF